MLIGGETFFRFYSLSGSRDSQGEQKRDFEEFCYFFQYFYVTIQQINNLLWKWKILYFFLFLMLLSKLKCHLFPLNLILFSLSFWSLHFFFSSRSKSSHPMSVELFGVSWKKNKMFPFPFLRGTWYFIHSKEEKKKISSSFFFWMPPSTMPTTS